MTEDGVIDIEAQAKSWVLYWLAPKGSPEREEHSWATDYYDFEYEEPEKLWLLILAIHQQPSSMKVQPVTAAGPVEDLLAMHGNTFIERIEAQAKEDPSFAKLLGGVWKNSMSDENWARVQTVWDRRGWDGIPE